MPRRLRKDNPGAWWHVTNRGVDRQPIFGSRAEYRIFLARLARCVREGWIEVHAFCLMPNHFHLLVHSLTGDLSKAIKHLEDGYALRFNQARGRVGPLFQGRFRAKRIDSDTYWISTFLYIHRNPVAARLCELPREYAWSSAGRYCGDRVHPWLSTNLGTRLGKGWATTRYRDAMEGLRVGFDRWQEVNSADEAALDRMLREGVKYISEWIRRGAADSGASLPLTFLCAPRFLLGALGARHARGPSGGAGSETEGATTRDPMTAGLLRTVAGLSTTRISRVLGCAQSTAFERTQRHLAACVEDPAYRGECAQVVAEALRRAHGEAAGLLRHLRRTG